MGKAAGAWIWVLTFIWCRDQERWSYTSNPPCVFMAWCLIKHRDDLIFLHLMPNDWLFNVSILSLLIVISGLILCLLDTYYIILDTHCINVWFTVFNLLRQYEITGFHGVEDSAVGYITPCSLVSEEHTSAIICPEVHSLETLAPIYQTVWC
jgi:hypothetical protein